MDIKIENAERIEVRVARFTQGIFHYISIDSSLKNIHCSSTSSDAGITVRIFIKNAPIPPKASPTVRINGAYNVVAFNEAKYGCTLLLADADQFGELLADQVVSTD